MWETEIAEIVETVSVKNSKMTIVAISVKNSTMTIVMIIPADNGTGWNQPNRLQKPAKTRRPGDGQFPLQFIWDTSKRTIPLPIPSDAVFRTHGTPGGINVPFEWKRGGL
jgi:hypothetical protein